MRKESSNQFTEGLVCDLNPINTPNTVLTDALNATLITYDGNEFSLQNDRGNYPLKNCRLKPNYIPVGLKEHGDILYIVSYNPLDNHVEVGSYPSPLLINDTATENNSDEIVCNSIIQSEIIDKNLEEGEYSKLVENAQSIIFSGDEYKLNPGDEYCLEAIDDDSQYKYETIEYHILDEESNPHNITDKIVVSDNGEYSHVAWTAPGWLTIKPRLVEMSTAGINVKSFYVPKTENDEKTAYFSFDFRLNIKDEYLINKGYLENWCADISENDLTDVKFRIFIEKSQGNTFVSVFDDPFIEFNITDVGESKNGIILSNCGWGEWFNKSRVLWKNVYGNLSGLSANDVIKVTMIPILSEEKYNYKIVYDNLKQEQIFDLNNIEDDEWTVGSELYQFYVSDDKQTQYIYTNVAGPKISSFPVTLSCDVYDLNGNLLLSNHKLSGYSGIGENLLQIPYNDVFKKEEIYIINFKFISEFGSDIFPSVRRILITSEVFNDFSNRLVYDKEIVLNEWINNYWNKCKINTDIEIVSNGKQSIYDWHSDLTEADNRYLANGKNNTFFPEHDPGLSNTIVYRKGYIDEYDIVNNSTIDELKGPIWDSFGSIESTFAYKDATDEFSILSDNIDIKKYVESIYTYNKDNSFLFVNADEKNFIDHLSDYTGIENIGKITDYEVEINIHVVGNKKKTEEEDDPEDDDARTAWCKCRILKNGKCWNKKKWYNTISEILRGVVIERDKKDSKVTVYDSDENGSDGYLVWKAHGAGIKEACLAPRLIVSWALEELQLPFILTRVNYHLSRASSNWEINTSVLGGENISGFNFNMDANGGKTCYYLGFPRRIDEYSCETHTAQIEDESLKADYEELKNRNPVMVPFVDWNGGKECFENLCKNLFYIEDDKGLENTSIYILSAKETNTLNSKIDVYHKIKFSKYEYAGHNLNDVLSKQLWLEDSNVLYTEILSGTIEEAEYNLIYSKTLESSVFDINKWPYANNGNNIGFDELKRNIDLCASHSKTDLNNWFISSQYNDVKEGKRTTLKGVHSKKESEDRRFIQDISNSFEKFGKVSLYGSPFDENAPGDSKTMLDDLAPNWWFDITATILVVLPSLITLLPGIWLGMPILGGLLASGAVLGTSLNNNEKIQILLALLSSGGVSSQVLWTNKQWLLDTEARVYYVFGTCWKTIPTMRLDQYWSWIKHEV